jgi:hypothetical protein
MEYHGDEDELQAEYDYNEEQRKLEQVDEEYS